LHLNITGQEHIVAYEKDEDIKRITGSIAGYIYYYYTNYSKNNNYLCETVTFNERKFVEIAGEPNLNEFTVKVQS
jgi:hypothetical protein